MFALIAQLFKQSLFTWGRNASQGGVTQFGFEYRKPSNSASGANQAEMRMLGNRLAPHWFFLGNFGRLTLLLRTIDGELILYQFMATFLLQQRQRWCRLDHHPRLALHVQEDPRLALSSTRYVFRFGALEFHTVHMSRRRCALCRLLSDSECCERSISIKRTGSTLPRLTLIAACYA